jgi:hypothetical protein
MTRWEYSKLVRTINNGKPHNWVEVMGQDEQFVVAEEGKAVAKAMAQLGLERWELVTLMSREEVIETLDPAQAIQVKATEYYFKRPLYEAATCAVSSIDE